MEKLYDLWAKRNPEFETRYQESIIEVFCEYGKGVNQYTDARGKTFGAGYEIYILAFFIGVYSNQTKPLVKDTTKRKHFGQPIMYWGNIEERNGRVAYGQIRQYIFAALIARTNIDFIALDKGDITPRQAVDALIEKMEEYANFGFDYMKECMEENPNCFFKETGFLRVFTSFLKSADTDDEEDDTPESLD